MAMHPQDRPSSIGEFRALLNGDEIPSSSGVPLSRPTWAVVLRRDLALIVLAGLLLLASLLISLGF